ASAFADAASAGAVFAGGAIATGYADVRAQLRPLFEDQRDLNSALRDTARIAIDARQQLKPIGELYQRLTLIGREYGIEQGRIAKLTATIAKSARLSGGSSESQAAGIQQLAQGLGSGTLQGDELRSVRENTLRLAKAIADGLGVSIGELKKLGSEGKLTTEVITAALEKSAATIDKEFARLPATLSSAFTTAATQVTVFFGRVDQGLGATERLANVILLAANNLDTLARVAAIAGAAFAGRTFVGFAQQLQTNVAAAKSVGTAIQGIGAAARESALAEVAAANAAKAALVDQARQLEANIVLIERQRAAALRSLEASQASRAAGFGRIAGPDVAAAIAGLNQSTRALITTRRALEATNIELAASEQLLASAKTRAQAVTTTFRAPIGQLAQAKQTLLGAGKGLVNFLGGSWGVAFTAAAGVLGYNATKLTEVQKAADRLGVSEDELRDRIGLGTKALLSQNEALRENARLKAGKELDEARDAGVRQRSIFAKQLQNQASIGSNFARKSDQEAVRRIADQFSKGTITTLDALKDLQVVANNSPRFKPAYERLFGTAENVLATAVAYTELKKQVREADKAEIGSGTVKGGRTSGKIFKGFAGGSEEKSVAELNAEAKAIADGTNAVQRAEAELGRVRGEALRELKAGKIDNAEYTSRVAQAQSALNAARDAEKARKESIRESAKASREATRDEDRRLRSLEQVADLERQIADITGRYDDQPNRIQRALADARKLDDIQGTRLSDKSVFNFDVDAEKAKITQGIARDIAKANDERAQEYKIDQLVLAGRDREAALLQAKIEFQREFGSAQALELQAQAALIAGDEKRAETLREFARIIAEGEAAAVSSAGKSFDLSEAKVSADRLASIYESVPQSLQQGFEQVFENIERRGIKSAKDLFNVFKQTFFRLQAQLLGEALFGGLDRQIGRDVRGQIAGQGSQSSIVQSASANPLAAIQGLLGTIFSTGARTLPTDKPDLSGVILNSSEKSIAAQNDTKEAILSSGAAIESAARDVVGAVLSGAGKTATVVSEAAKVVLPSGVAQQKQGESPVEIFNRVGQNIGDRLDKIFNTKVFGKVGSKAGDILQGAAIGQIAGSTAKLLGAKTSSLGSQLGGALGSGLASITAISSALGPIGTALAPVVTGLLGGVLGGLLKKTPKSSATVSTSGGQFQDATVTGTSASRRQAASSLGDAFQKSVETITDQLGAQIGDVRLSIGTRKKKFVVDPTGAGRTKGPGVQKFDSEEAAVEAALRIALSKGVAKGISAASQRILQSGQDLEKAVEKAALIESIPKRLKQLTDPVGFAVEELNKQFEKMIDALLEGGATAQQIADAEKLYGLERKNAIEQAAQQQSDAIDRFLTSITAGGSSPLSKADTFNNAKAALQGFRADINAGKAVDDNKLVDALQTFYDAARELKGSRGDFFADFADIKDLAERAKAINTAGSNTTNPGQLPPSPFETGDRAAKLDQYLNQQNTIGSTTNNLLAGLPKAIADALREGVFGSRGAVGGGNSSLGLLPFNQRLAEQFR
ncbi:MAG TPA: hypothetical protein DDZ68_12810, partial [Parvularcula sp.]|nr:hypothetical protein [Parvularcula sp.]